ncbi:peptide ABC transporter ATP-binding protein [Gemmobacter aquarius]|uniref:Peptide ABC transporter ATP-binding protein n=1 Tax=Paragemmobacter aquarius TaxID=2169400 RepID=A0A2S0UIZ8_9RHOB|nr:ABC transporter ATP-binding protein [Gemmobacter aquarius]AWB47700.1 peptide ABC transporter ATP-binding protein [Gemmobacter aquarius]
MTPVLDLRNLSVDLPLGGFMSRAALPILQDVSLSVGRGQSVALVGESGSGKTTLARAVMGLQPVTSGAVRFDGSPVTGRDGFARLRRDAAMMFQDAAASLSPRLTVGYLVTEAFRIHRQPLPDPAATARLLLARVGLPPAIADRYPHELSGGQARRVGVARALALGPRLVIADEPTAGLDVSVQAEVLNLMADLRRDMGLAYLIITHNLALVRHVADRIVVLYLGRVVEEGPTAQVFAAPAHPYTASLIASEPRPDPRRRRADLAIKGEVPSILRRPSGCEFHTRCPLVQDICRSTAPALLPTTTGRLARCHFADPNQQQGDTHALEH